MEIPRIGHFDLLFTVMYAWVVTSIFQTLSGAPRIRSFEFFMGLTLLVVVVDHWLLHFRNKEQIFLHSYFSLAPVILVLFFYAKLSHILSNHEAKALGSKFWV